MRSEFKRTTPPASPAAPALVGLPVNAPGPSSSNRAEPPIFGRERRGPVPQALTPYQELTSGWSNPHRTNEGRKRALRLVESLLDARLPLDEDAKEQARSLAGLVAFAGNTAADRNYGQRMEHRLRLVRALPRSIDLPDLSGVFAPVDSPTKRASFRQALLQLTGCIEALGGSLWTLAATRLLNLTGLTPEEAVQEIGAAKSELIRSGALRSGSSDLDRVDDLLRAILDQPSPGGPRWAEQPDANLPLGDGRLVGHQRIIEKVRAYALAESQVSQGELDLLATREQQRAIERMVLDAPIHIRAQVEGLAEVLERDLHWRGMLENGGRTSGNPNPASREGPEGRLFGYDHQTPNSARPKYGYVNVSNAPEGQASSFGGVVFCVHERVKAAATIHYGDAGRVGARSLGVFEEGCIGHVLVDLLRVGPGRSIVEVATGQAKSRPWNGPWVEAVIHRPIDLQAGDFVAMGIDAPSAATPDGQRLIALMHRLGVEVRVEPEQTLEGMGWRG